MPLCSELFVVISNTAHVPLSNLVHHVLRRLLRPRLICPRSAADERALYAVRSQNYLLVKFYLSGTNFCLFSK